MLAIVFAHVVFFGNRFTLMLQAVALGASPLEIGLVLGVLMLGPMLLCVQFGRWSDRMGYTRLCALGIAMCLSACLLAAAVGAMPALYAASALTGTGYMLVYVAGLNAIGKLTADQDVTRALSVLTMALSVSALVGPLMAGFFIDLGAHAWAYLGLSAFAVASALQLAWAARRYRMQGAPTVAGASGGVRDLLKVPAMRAVFIMAALLSMGWDTFGFLAPLHAVASGHSATATGVIVGAFAAGSFAVRLCLPAMSRRLGEWRLISVALLVTGVAFIAFPLLHDFRALVCIAFLLGMSLGCSQPLSMSLIHRAAPAGRAGEAGGLRAAMVSLSQTTLPVMFGGLGSAVGLPAVFWCASLLLLAGSVRAMRDSSA